MTSHADPTLRESYSLWLMPEGALAERLHHEICRLARRFPDAAPFQPHVTLLGGIDRALPEVLQAAEQLSESLQPYRVTFDSVSSGDMFHQCVYILCGKSPEAMAAAAAARRAYGLDPCAPYMPHLSLLYSDVDTATRQAVAAEQQQALFGGNGGPLAGDQDLGFGGNGGPLAGDGAAPESGFEADSVAVWYTPVDDKSLLSWRQVARFELAGPAAQ